MALQVWLPLNGTLKNNGLNNYSLTIARGTDAYHDSGKIGKCFYSNGVNTLSIDNIIPDFYNYTAYTLSAWFYIEAQNTAHTGSAIISAGAWNQQLLNLALSHWSDDHYTKLQVSGTSWNKTYTYNFNKNTWYHVVVSSDGNKTYAYVNGNLIGDSLPGFLPTSILGNNIYIGGATYHTSMQFFGRINDVRIYDHCLSPKEVHDLALGLVLHYKLDYTNPNLFLQTPKSITPTSYCAYLLNLSENLVADLTYTMLLWDVDIAGSASSRLRVFWGGGNTSLFSWYVSSDFINGHADHLVKTFTVTSSQASGVGSTNLWLNLYNYPSSSTDKNMHIGAWKLEKGSVATPLTYNEDAGIIYDSSGYQNDGSIVGSSLSITSDTPRYQLSTSLQNSSAIKVVDNNWLSQGMELMAINVWAKTTNWSAAHLFSCTEGGGFNTEAGNSGYLNFPVNVYTNSSKTSYAYQQDKQAIKIADLSTTDWNMLTFVYSTSGTKTYLNGLLHHLNDVISYGIHFYLSARLFLGCEASGANPSAPYFTGELSDFRIYTTVLSDDDILDLYKVGASVDNKLNFYAYEILENGSLQILPKTSISLSGHSSYYSQYLSISPGVYDYDIIYEATGSDNYNLIGFERLDENKTSTSNNGCRYVHNKTGASSKTRIFGTVNLTTDLNSNPVAFTRLRVLNDWNNKNANNSLTIYSISLMKSGTYKPLLILHTGEAICNEFQELDNTSIRSNGITETNNIYEI